MKHHLNENSTRPVWTRVSTRLHQQRQSWSPLSAAVLALATWLYSVNLATASIIVDNPGDSHVVGKISLREAIQRASAIDDVITFAPGITLVTLSAGELGIARGVTFSGAGVAVKGQPGNRVFNIAATGQARISGLEIASGSPTGNGGAILNSGTLELNGCLVRDSTTTGSGASGGGIFNSGSLTLDHCLVRGCTANSTDAKGGGIFNSGTLTLRLSAIRSCAAVGSDAKGGGIFNSGTLSLFAAELSANSVGPTAGEGGGIYNLGSAIFDLADAQIFGNRTGDGGRGGGIRNAGGTNLREVTINHSAISDNTAMVGAGIDNLGIMSIYASTIDNNHASLGLYGGGGGVDNQAFLAMTNSTIAQNEGAAGGGILNDAFLTLEHCTIAENTAAGQYGCAGGGVDSGFHGDARSPLVHNTIIARNNCPDAPDPVVRLPC